MEWVALLVIILILGALAGGKDFGDTVGKGCGCLVVLIVIAVVYFTGLRCPSGSLASPVAIIDFRG